MTKLLVVLSLALATLLAAATPAAAAPMTDVQWGVSANTVGVAGVRYTWSFTTVTTDTLASVTMTVPTGTGGASLTVDSVSGLPSGGSATLSNGTVTYSFTATEVLAGVQVVMAIDGFTNAPAPETAASEVTTRDDAPQSVDQGSSNSVSFSYGALTSVQWSVSNAAVGAPAVRYTWSFTTGTSSTLSDVTFTVPAGTVGASLVVATVSGLPSGGSATLSNGTVTYSFTPSSVGSGVPVAIAIDGFTNQSSAGSFSSVVTTENGINGIDTGTSNTIAFVIPQARSTTMSGPAPTHSFTLDPSAPALSDVTNTTTMVISTTAEAGYTLTARIDHQLRTSALTYTIPATSPGVADGFPSASFPINTFGFTANASGIDANAPSLIGALASGSFVGYTTNGESFASNNGPVSADSIVVTSRVRIDYHQSAGVYTATITYTVVPNYQS